MKRSGSDNSSKVATDVDEKEGKMSKKSRNTLFILFFSLVLDLLGFTVILPLMPSILEYYGRSDGQVNALLVTYYRNTPSSLAGRTVWTSTGCCGRI